MNDWKALPEREQAIIDHVARYRLSTDEVLHELFFAGAQSVKTVQKAAARLVAAGWLDKFQAVGRRNIYVLGSNFESLRPRRGSSASFSEQTLPETLAILYFCVRHRHRRLTVPEIRSVDSRLCETGLRNAAYYVAKREKTLGLSLLFVDRDSPVRRITWKIRRLVGQRNKRDGFRQWILDRRFSVTILTAFAEKQQQLVQAFPPTAQALVPIQVVLVPEFAPYLS